MSEPHGPVGVGVDGYTFSRDVGVVEGAAGALLEGLKRPGEGWMMNVGECFENAREAPGYTTFELALVCLAHHFAALVADREAQGQREAKLRGVLRHAVDRARRYRADREALLAERDALSQRVWSYESQMDDERKWKAEAQARVGVLEGALRDIAAMHPVDSGLCGADVARAVLAGGEAAATCSFCGKQAVGEASGRCLVCGVLAGGEAEKEKP